MKRMTALLLTLLLVCPAFASEGDGGPNGELTLLLDRSGTGVYQEETVSAARFAVNGFDLAGDMPAFILDGRAMVPLRLAAEQLDAQVTWLEEEGAVLLERGEHTMLLTFGSDRAEVDGQAVTLYDGVAPMTAQYEGVDRAVVPLRFVSEYLGARVHWVQETYTAAVSTIPEDAVIVVLDPGHGGTLHGACYEGVREEEINLAVALKLEPILTGLGYTVILTRCSDSTVSLYDRANIANAVDADLFVSLHSNAAANLSSYTGIYTYRFPGSQQGALLAQAIQAAVCPAVGAIDRGVHEGNYAVLRKTNMCAALVEMGFMTNHEELTNLCDPSYQDLLAQGIAQGIVAYLDSLGKTPPAQAEREPDQGAQDGELPQESAGEQAPDGGEIPQESAGEQAPDGGEIPQEPEAE